jgi:hypothetical protein
MKAAMYTVAILVLMTVMFIPSLASVVYAEIKRKRND